MQQRLHLLHMQFLAVIAEQTGLLQPSPPWCRQTLKRSITWRHTMAISMQVLNPIVTVASELCCFKPCYSQCSCSLAPETAVQG